MNAEEFIDRLKRSFNAPSKKDERIKVVLICIVISTTFWFFNALNQDNYISQISYPVEWEYDKDNYIPVKALPSRISLEVNGGGWDLMARYFGFSMKPINIELTEPASTGYLLTSQLRAELSRNLDPVTINFMIQDSLLFDIQPKISRTIGLEFDESQLNFDSDYRLASDYRLSTDSMLVTGPKNLIEQMPSTLTCQLDLEGIDRDINEELSLPQLPPLVQSDLETLTVSFEVMRYVSISERKPVQLVNFPDSTWQAIPNEILVEYQIGEAVFDALDSTRLSLIADFERWDPQDSTLIIEVIQGREMMENIRLATEEIKVIKP